MDFATDHIVKVLLMTTFAGLATGIGGFITFFMKKTDTKLLTLALGFSGGVMIYISMVELLGLSQRDLVSLLGSKEGGLVAIAAFFGGIGIAALIDKCIPTDENPHELQEIDDLESLRPANGQFTTKAKVKRSGFLFALAIGIHNFPEGIATFASGMQSISLGASIAIAVAVHNIPEGMIVAVPLYYGTGSRKKAIFYSFLSGLAEPVGAILAMWLIFPFLGSTPALLPILYAAVAGIMVFISFDELLPMAEKWGHHHLSIYGIISGMLLMALVLL